MNLHTATLPSQKVIPAQLMPAHLTPAQLDALLSPNASARDAAAAEAHLLLCPACAAELDHLRDSISLFRQASSNHASRELNNLQPLSLPTRSLLLPALQPTHWFAVAATLLIALLPLQTFRARPIQSTPAEAYSALDPAVDSAEHQSDAALLDDVDREVSASIPTSMQALADPTQSDAEASTALNLQAPTNAPVQTPDQGKD
jgi:anti-sigma factor RsiW